jgi:hypothetical protein
MEKVKHTYKSLIRKPEWKRHLEDLFVEGDLYEGGS